MKFLLLFLWLLNLSSLFLALPITYRNRTLLIEELKKLSDLENPLSLYKREQLLGSGYYAKVYNATSLLDPLENVALKIMNVTVDKHIGYAINEIVTSRLVNSSHVIPIDKVYYVNNTVYMTMRFVNGETIDHYYKEFTEESFVILSYQTLTFLNDLRNASVCHDDISASNIILDSETQTIYFIDFGIARQISSTYSRENDWRTTRNCRDLEDIIAFLKEAFEDASVCTGKLDTILRLAKEVKRGKQTLDSILKDPVFEGISNSQSVPLSRYRDLICPLYIFGMESRLDSPNCPFFVQENGCTASESEWKDIF